MGIVDQFETIDLAAIDRYLDEHRAEDLHLDFKLTKGPELNSTDDKRNLSIATSGFANSEGGLIVWGVDARKNSEGVDCATKSIPIKQLSLFVSRLDELAASTASPVVDGVRNKKIETAHNTGYAVTYVPESDKGPHMAKLGENRFYKRNAASFLLMEQFDLADMFGRRQRPHLVLVATYVAVGGDEQIVIGVRNVGRATALAPYVAFSSPGPFAVSSYGLDGNGNSGMTRGISTDLVVYSEHAGFAIHPGVTLNITRLICRQAHLHLVKNPLELSFKLAAVDGALRSGVLAVIRENAAVSVA